MNTYAVSMRDRSRQRKASTCSRSRSEPKWRRPAPAWERRKEGSTLSNQSTTRAHRTLSARRIRPPGADPKARTKEGELKPIARLVRVPGVVGTVLPANVPRQRLCPLPVSHLGQHLGIQQHRGVLHPPDRFRCRVVTAAPSLTQASASQSRAQPIAVSPAAISQRPLPHGELRPTRAPYSAHPDAAQSTGARSTAGSVRFCRRRRARSGRPPGLLRRLNTAAPMFGSQCDPSRACLCL
jgi:hypothetical protein